MMGNLPSWVFATDESSVTIPIHADTSTSIFTVKEAAVQLRVSQRTVQGILFDDDDDEIDLGPLRPVRPATAKTRRGQLRAAASCLVHSGVPASDIHSIATLVEVKNARLILNFLMQRQGGEPRLARLGCSMLKSSKGCARSTRPQPRVGRSGHERGSVCS